MAIHSRIAFTGFGCLAWLVILLCSGSLLTMGQENQASDVPTLISKLKDADRSVRRNAIEALSETFDEPALRNGIPDLQDALKDSDALVRRGAAGVLGNIGSGAKAAVQDLSNALKDPDPNVRRTAATSLAKIGIDAKPAINALSEALTDEDSNVRIEAARSLGTIGADHIVAVPALCKALKDPDPFVRRSSAYSLGRSGAEAKAGVPALSEALETQNPDSDVYRLYAANALGSIALALKDARATDAIPQLKQAHDVLLKLQPQTPEIKDQAIKVELTLNYLESLWWDDWIRNNKSYFALIAAYTALFFACLILLWIRPVLLLRINDQIPDATDFRLPAWLGGFSLPLRYVFIVGFFRYHPRVLDAWVFKHIETSRKSFAQKATVEARQTHIPVPVVLNKENIASLTPDSLRVVFTNNLSYLLIWGEGGSGKTSLACLFAKWAMDQDKRLIKKHFMLPVIIEQELELQNKDGESALLKTIADQVKGLIDSPEIIPYEMVRRLLKQRRILVIVDSFSEMSATSRSMILANILNIPISSAIFTSRNDELLNDLRKHTLKPLRIIGNRLSTFMEAYLTSLGKRDLFEDDEFFEACRQLSVIVGERDITVLLAKYYAEQMIASKEGSTDEDLPENIPDLMLNYINRISGKPTPDAVDIRLVHRGAEILAWECLRETYRPVAARLSDVLTALGPEEEGLALLKYLESKLKVIQTVGAGRDRVRFALDPLAEYLAGLFLVKTYGASQESWDVFLSQANEKDGAPETIKGFLLAVRDCCLTKASDANIPSHVTDELAKLAGVNPQDRRKARTERRVRRLIQDLKLPDVEERVEAVKALAAMNQEAMSAIPALIDALADDHYYVRYKAAYALGNIGTAAKAAAPSLIELLKDQNEAVRRNAAYSLGRIGFEAKRVVPALVDVINDQDEIVRRNVAIALGSIGSEAKAATPALMMAVNDQDAFVRRNATNALGSIGPEAKAAIPTLIEAMKHEDDYIRMGAADALGAMGPEAKAAVPGLIELLKDPDALIRRSAAHSIGRIGVQAKPAVPALIELLKDQNVIVRRNVADALGNLGPEAKLAIPALSELLNDPDEYMRLRAVHALGNIGPEARVVVATLIELLNDQNEDVRTTTADALGKIRQARVPAINVEVADDNAEV